MTNEELVQRFLAEIKAQDKVLATKKSALIRFADWLENLTKKSRKQ